MICHGALGRVNPTVRRALLQLKRIGELRTACGRALPVGSLTRGTSGRRLQVYRTLAEAQHHPTADMRQRPSSHRPTAVPLSHMLRPTFVQLPWTLVWPNTRSGGKKRYTGRTVSPNAPANGPLPVMAGAHRVIRRLGLVLARTQLTCLKKMRRKAAFRS